MFRLTRSALTLRGVKSPRSITTNSLKQHEQVTQKENNYEEAATEEATLDTFTKEFLGNQIKVTDFQRILLTAGSSIAALLDPRRHDMIACLGETTGKEALYKILQIMKSSDEGQEILREKPRINTKTVNLDELKNLPNDTFGHHYFKFLDDNVS
jgi:ubiquinone biosynthesis protein COQ4